ncbi:MAG: XdhC family protein, partial [bacterium]
MKEIRLWGFVLSHLLKNNPVILISVVHHEKGSPGKQGFRMAVSREGDYTGSVGGGVMELNILKQSKNNLESNIPVNKIETLYHNRKKSVRQSGLICAGAQTNFILTINRKDIQKVKNILKYLNENKQGKIIFSNDGFDFENEADGKNKNLFTFESENNWRYEESIGFRAIVIVAGCGHVGLAVCRIMCMLDFHVISYDDRKDLQQIKENIYADEIIFDAYRNIENIIKNTGEEFIVIVTT